MDTDAPGSDVTTADPRTRFTYGDFVIAVFGGLVAAAVVVAPIIVIPEVTGGQALSGTGLIIAALIGQFTGHLLAVWVVMRRRQISWSDIGLRFVPRDGLYLLAGVGIQIALALAFTPLLEALGSDGSSQALTEDLLEIDSLAARLAMAALVGLVAPVVEELMFRGVLIGALGRRIAPTGVMFISAIVFAMFHLLSVTPDTPPLVLLVLIAQLTIVGMILARFTLMSGRLGPAIATHAGFNLLAVVATFLVPELIT